MKMVMRLSVCSVGIALAVIVGQSVAHGVDVPSDTQAKQTAVDRALTDIEDSTVVANANSMQEVAQEAFVGTPKDVADIQSTIPGLVASLLNVQDMPQAPAERAQVLSARIAQARVVLGQVFAQTVLDSEFAVITQGIEERANVPEMEMMQEAEMGPATFQRIRVSGSTADVAFTATTRRLTTAHGWIDEGRSQWQLKLVNVSGHWQLLNNNSMALDGEG